MVVSWGEESRPLASNTGWSQFGAWADTLDPEAYRQVVHLWEHGYATDVAALAKQLDGAIKHNPPKDHTVHDTAEGLLEAVRMAKGADAIGVSNGMGPDDGADEFDHEAGEYDLTPEEAHAE
jgi:hypothetical protein